MICATSSAVSFSLLSSTDIFTLGSPNLSSAGAAAFEVSTIPNVIVPTPVFSTLARGAGVIFGFVNDKNAAERGEETPNTTAIMIHSFKIILFILSPFIF